MRCYDSRLMRLLEEIGSTPTGWPLVDWVRLHWPQISFGDPPVGAAFAYPWPITRIVIRDNWDEEWQRETLVHELAHIIRWRGHLVGSLEQEYDAYLTAAKVRCEWNGWDWSRPDEQAVTHYPHFFGPHADKDAYKHQLRERLPFYAILPWDQPAGLLPVMEAIVRQGWFGCRLFAQNLLQWSRPVEE